jgi:hypothetical protein
MYKKLIIIKNKNMHSTKKDFYNSLAIIAKIMLNFSLAQDLNSQKTEFSKSNSFLQKTELKETFDKDWIKGFWIGKGYGCAERKNIPEDINVEFINGKFEATKVHGDACVPTGIVTFNGELQQKWKTNQQYPWTITLVSPAKPASGKAGC